MAVDNKFWPGQWQWPLPAVLAWLLTWLLFKLLAGQGADPGLSLGLASALGVACTLWGETWWRRLLIGAGFPLSLAIFLTSSGSIGIPAWAWLLPAGCLKPCSSANASTSASVAVLRSIFCMVPLVFPR